MFSPYTDDPPHSSPITLTPNPNPNKENLAYLNGIYNTQTE